MGGGLVAGNLQNRCRFRCAKNRPIRPFLVATEKIGRGSLWDRHTICASGEKRGEKHVTAESDLLTSLRLPRREVIHWVGFNPESLTKWTAPPPEIFCSGLQMAKWGEGDPRWVVESRPDGTNVNGWHWEEKNRMDWSKRRLSEVLCGLTCCSGRARITALKDLSGAAAVCTRKGGKKFVTYELTLELSWEGAVAAKKVKGEIKISEFACVNDPDEYVFSITTKTSGDEENELKNDWKQSKESICEVLAQYTTDLHAS